MNNLNEPLRSCGRLRTLGMMELADCQMEFASQYWWNVRRERRTHNLFFPPHHQDVCK